MKVARLDRLWHDRAVRRYGHHHLPRLIGHDRGGGDQQGRGRAASGDAQPRELPGRNGQVRIDDGRAGMDRPAAAIDGVVDKIERAVTVEMSIPAEADDDIGVRSSTVVRLLIGQVIGLAHIEVEVDRVERHDRGEQRRGACAAAAAAYQAPQGYEMLTQRPNRRSILSR